MLAIGRAPSAHCNSLASSHLALAPAGAADLDEDESRSRRRRADNSHQSLYVCEGAGLRLLTALATTGNTDP